MRSLPDGLRFDRNPGPEPSHPPRGGTIPPEWGLLGRGNTVQLSTNYVCILDPKDRLGEMAISSPPLTQGPPAAGATARLRPVAALYLGCVLALAVGGGLLGVGLLKAGSAHHHAHAAGGAPGLGSPVPTSFGLFQVESIAQIRGLTPKALAGMTHAIQSLVKADQMQVQMLIALRNNHAQNVAYDPALFRLRLVRPSGKSTAYESVSTSVRAGSLLPKSELETTVAFVVPRFTPKGTRLSLEFLEQGRAPVALDLGPVRPGGSLSAVQAALAGHQH
jgi:hypothetical protein